MSRPRVLYVDDDEACRRAIKRRLVERFQPTLASSVLEACALLDADRFEIVISDYSFASGSGRQVLEHAAVCQPAARRVLLSGAPPSDADRFAHLVLWKPWPDDVCRILEQLLNAG